MKYGPMVVVALLALAVASPVMALTQDEAQQITKEAGCPAETSFVEWPISGWNAGYGQLIDGPVILLINMENMSHPQQLLVLYHEIGHCLGAKDEWDADKYAIRQIAQHGLDGAEIADTLWADGYRDDGFVGDADDVHGLTTERSTRGRLNRVMRRIES